MAQRQYLIVLYILFANASVASASPWVPKIGRYHYFANYERITERDVAVPMAAWEQEQQLHQIRIDLQKQQENISKNPRMFDAQKHEKLSVIAEDIRQVDLQIAQMHDAYNMEPRAYSNQLEYGVADRVSIGIKYYGSILHPYAQYKTNYNEFSAFTKIAVKQGDSYVISVAPHITSNSHKKTIIGGSFFIGKAKRIGLLRQTEFKLLDNVEIKIDDFSKTNRYTATNTLGLEIGNRVWLLYDVALTDFATQRKFVQQHLRHKISLACKINDKEFAPVIQTSYFTDYWVGKIGNRNSYFKVADGFGIGLWVNF